MVIVGRENMTRGTGLNASFCFSHRSQAIRFSLHISEISFWPQNVHGHFYLKLIHPIKSDPNHAYAMKVVPNQLHWKDLFFWISQTVSVYVIQHLTLTCFEAPGTSWTITYLLMHSYLIFTLQSPIHSTQAHTGPPWAFFYARLLYSCLGRLFISRTVFPASNHLKKILSWYTPPSPFFF